jgi:hypothetical protein
LEALPYPAILTNPNRNFYKEQHGL